jgi:hypothetical protein
MPWGDDIIYLVEIEIIYECYENEQSGLRTWKSMKYSQI